MLTVLLAKGLMFSHPLDMLSLYTPCWAVTQGVLSVQACLEGDITFGMQHVASFQNLASG